MAKPLWIEPLAVERYSIRIRDLPSDLEGIKLVQLSDLHYDNDCLSDRLLDQAIAISNQANPDLVVLTGDYINYQPAPIFPLAQKLRSLTSRYGIYAALGNHDISHPAARSLVTQALSEAKIQVLWNAIATPLGEQFPLVGLADYWSQEFDPEPVMRQLDPKLPRLVLSHNPDTAKFLHRWRVDLQLSGHTHGGQIYLPSIGSVPQIFHEFRQALPSSLVQSLPWLRKPFRIVQNWQWDRGLHAIGNNQLYVNRGLGTYFPGRLFCSPEITLLRLVRA
jgi:predicted MPP superfamily phosphohydrolase